LLVFLLELFPRPLGMFQSGPAHHTGPDFKPIMLAHTLGCPNKGMLTAKVRPHPFQPS
jgi:hypothetical protein